MKKRSIKIISDPGHAWGSVSKKDIEELGISHLISHHSYEKANRVYLEEDCDLKIFLSAARKAGWKINLKESFSDKRSWIRSTNVYEKKRNII